MVLQEYVTRSHARGQHMTLLEKARDVIAPLSSTGPGGLAPGTVAVVVAPAVPTRLPTLKQAERLPRGPP